VDLRHFFSIHCQDPAGLAPDSSACDKIGRGLTTEEIREVTHMIRRIAALIALQPALDKNYTAVRDNSFDFSPGLT
jgi:hypothetical protein